MRLSALLGPLKIVYLGLKVVFDACGAVFESSRTQRGFLGCLRFLLVIERKRPRYRLYRPLENRRVLRLKARFARVAREVRWTAS